MRARGYDISVIEDAVRRSVRWHEKEALKDAVRAAFADVRLGGGVGLYEGQALDGYADQATRARLREKDEKLDWAALKAKALNECHSSLSFFDAEGMRFHLPAYLCAELDDDYDFDLLYTITSVQPSDGRFSLLDRAQRSVVNAYLNFVLPDCYGADRIRVEAATTGYWAREV